MADLIAITKNKDNVTSHVIFIHGLNGHPLDTWQSLLEPKECWLNWLDKDIDNVAVWTVGYEASISLWTGAAMHLTDRARNVLERILLEPKLQAGKIILVGHSLGGLVIKQLLRTAEGMVHKRKDVAGFLERINGIAFIATPHSGSDLASKGDRIRVLLRPTAATASLVRNDANLRDLNIWYRDWSDKFNITHLILTETQPTGIFGYIVKPDNSDPGLSTHPICIDANHETICKPKNSSSDIYLHIKKFIETVINSETHKRVIEEASSSVGSELKILNEKMDGFLTASVIQTLPKDIIDREIEKELLVIRKSRFIGGYSSFDPSIQLAKKIKNGEFQAGSDNVKCKALAWCARILSISENVSQSDELLSHAKQLGSIPEIDIAESFILSANDQLDEALKRLADIESPAARSAGFIIFSHRKNASSAFEWLLKSGFDFSDLDADGKFVFINKKLELSQWDTALKFVNLLKEDDFKSTPVLLFLAGIIYLIQTVPEEFKTLVLQQIPFESKTFPLASSEKSINERRKAKEFFTKYHHETIELNCIDASKMIDDYILWIDLRDPDNFDIGLKKLQDSMSDPKNSLRRVHLALSFDLELDITAIEKEIEKQTALTGGNSLDSALARFALVFEQETPKDMADYIGHHRNQLQKYFGKQSINSLEIEVLAKAGLFQQAETILENLIDAGMSETDQNNTRSLIDKYKGDDPLEARRVQFEKSDKLNDLLDLVNLLETKGEWTTLCQFSLLLFEKTQSLIDAERLVNALSQAHRHTDIIDFLSTNSTFIEQSDNLKMKLSWALYFNGTFGESKAALGKIEIDTDDSNYQALTVNLAIASGDWESLLIYIEREWSNRENREADKLIKLAQLAQIVDSPRVKEIVLFATSKATNDASILAAAYFIATSAGWENESEVSQWLHDAAELSGDNGPIQRISIKDVIDKQPEWNDQTTETWEKLKNGELPIYAAAYLLRRSLVDMFLLPILANPHEQDLRRRVLVPAYSGARQTLPCDYQVIAIDATAILTLVTLNLFEKVCNVFEYIMIPHSTLGWLFEEKQKVLFHQPSKMKYASEIRMLLANGRLKDIRDNHDIDSDLSADIGQELASLIPIALSSDKEDEKQRVVIRSSPVHRVGSLLMEEVDLTPYDTIICSCLSVVNKLKQKGMITGTQESRAKAYLSLHEKNWPNEPEISDNATLYLDSLSVTYLQHTGLIDKLQPAGLDVYVLQSYIDEINSLLHYENITGNANDVIDKTRKILSDGIGVGKIKVGQMKFFDKGENLSLQNHPTIAVYNLSNLVDAIIVDDRFNNQHGYLDDDSIHTPILTTLDLINSLYSKGDITFEQMLDYRTLLRQSGYIFIPITKEELDYHLSASKVVNERIVETAELKSIRENLTQVRMTDFFKLPKESIWLTNLNHAFISSLKSQWDSTINTDIAAARSEWLLKIIDARKWSHFYDIERSSIIHIYGAQVMALLLAPQDIPDEVKNKYQEWVDENILKNIKEASPDIFLWIIERTKQLVSEIIDMEIIEGKNL